ncbi:hypothetical protein P0082_00895 [Candidatus Haliotispira prima]|uniref:Uncharacterized protein n=1 Tax=Candidatus Haliotispira prima TaxID=3034016 RepID=A0ABY8MIN6_9SPIO|nr:hypothetical protein P0082_00895 [Candidatus Haliotispira prima]
MSNSSSGSSSDSSSEPLFTVYAGKSDRELKRLTHIDGIRIERSLNNLAYGFQCTCVPHETEVHPGYIIRVYWKDQKHTEKGSEEPLFSGYVDRVKFNLSGGRNAALSLSIEARSFVSKMLDSTDSWNMHEGDLWETAQEVCRRYRVEIYKNNSVSLGCARFEGQGQSPYRKLNALVRAQGAILCSRGYGTLLITLPATETTGRPLTLDDLTEISGTISFSDRYNLYRIVSRGKKYEKIDTAVRKGRILELTSQDRQIDSINTQLLNEHNRRRGLSQKLQLVLPGWQIPGTETYWKENSNLELNIEKLGLDDHKLFIHAVNLSLSKFGGYRTELSLSERSAFAQITTNSTSGDTDKEPNMIMPWKLSKHSKETKK